MPPPCICLFQPRLLFPYDDYRGPLPSVAVICSGVCMEVLSLFFCFLWAVVGIQRGAPKLHWALLPLPIQSFDFLVFSCGLFRMIRSYSWLLPSEKRLRVLLLLGVFSRFCLSSFFSLYMLDKVPLLSLLAVSAVSYVASTVLNVYRGDPYTWVRLQCWDLVVLLQLLTLCLPSAFQSLSPVLGLPACFWPLWVLSGAHLCCCMLLGLLMLRDVLLQQNAVTRVLVHVLEVHAVSFLFATVFFSQWLSAYSKARFIAFVAASVVSFFLFFIVAAFAAICFIARHSTALIDDVEQGDGQGASRTPLNTSSAAAAAAAVGPPLMCDMKVTLEKVSEHFYRIRGPLEAPSAADQPVAPTEGPPDLHQTSATIETHQHQDEMDTPEGRAAAIPASGPAATPPTAGDAKGAAANTTVAADEASVADAAAAPATQEADAGLCMICYNTPATAVLMYCGHGGLCFKCAKRCFHRTGLCPTCRCHVAGVLEVQKPAEAQQTAHLEGVVRDISS